MLVSKSVSVVNNLWTASVGVTFTALEADYAKAYGEPIIERNGVIPFTPGEEIEAPEQLPLDQTTDLEAPLTPGTFAPVSGAEGVRLTGAGEWSRTLLAQGFWAYNDEVIGDFQFVARLEALFGQANPAAVDGFSVGLLLKRSDADASDAIILGYGGHGAPAVIELLEREESDPVGYSLVNETAFPAVPMGILFRMTRTSASLLAEYSIDNGATWGVAGTVTMAGQTWKAGLFVSSGDVTAVATALFTNLSLSAHPVPPQGTFTIAGENRALMRSQAPHVLSLNGNLDTEAEAKVRGWADEIKARLVTAKAALFASPNPGGENTEDVTQV